MVMALLAMHDSAVLPCFHGCSAFFQRHLAPQSPPSHPFQPSPHSQQQASPWTCSPIPELQLPDAMCSSGLASLSGLCRTAARIVFVVLTPFKLSQISCSTLRLKCFSALRQLPCCGDQTPTSVPPPAEGRSSTPIFPPSSFVLLSFVW